MSALAVDYAAAPDSVRMPVRPALVLVPTGPRVGGGRQLHPTRAGRLVVSVLAAAVLAVTVVLASGALGSATPAAHTVTVQPGQTLSEIAARELPGLSIGTAVATIQEANAMTSGGVDAGQVLVIPAAG